MVVLLNLKNNDIDYFIKRNKNKEIIAVQGLGFVGAVMSLVCANAINGNYAVIGVEVSTKRGKKITKELNNGIFPLVAEDPKIDQLFEKSIEKGNFFATTETDAYKVADIIIIDINLDVEKENLTSGALIDYNVDLSSFKKAIVSIGENCKEDALIIISETL